LIESPDDDVIGGTEKYKRMLYEAFYELRNHPKLKGTFLASLPGLTTSDNAKDNNNDQENGDMPRVTVEEPEECTGLL
jgi:hypothetical protein